MCKTLYTERLKALSGAAVGLMVILAVSLTVFGFYCYICKPEWDIGNTAVDIYGLAMILAVSVFLLYFALVKKITLTVTVDTVSVSYFKTFRYSVKDIRNVSLLSSEKTFRRFYGWGIRFNRSAIGFTVPGRDSVSISFSDRKDILISTARPEELKAVLESLLKA